MYRQTTLNKPKITAILPHAENAGLRDLFVDGAFYCTVPAALLMQQGLAVGDCFDEQALESLTFAAKLIPAKEKAYQYLEYGDLSRKSFIQSWCSMESRSRLRKRPVPDGGAGVYR